MTCRWILGATSVAVPVAGAPRRQARVQALSLDRARRANRGVAGEKAGGGLRGGPPEGSVR